MTVKLLERAFAEIAALPETEQEIIAAWILEEIASRRRWEEAFAHSEDALVRLADEALAEHRAGQTQELNPDAL